MLTDTQRTTSQNQEYLFGWNPTPGIVSVWAHRDGRAVVWQREGDQVTYTRDRYRPWLLATSLDDLSHLGKLLVPSSYPDAGRASISYQELDGPTGTFRYQLLAQNMRELEKAILSGASRRLKRSINRLNELDTYYSVGPVEQYLMQTGQVYFKDLPYESLHRMQIDLETTALDPHRGRIFLVAISDNRGLATTLEAPRPEDEPQLITALCQMIRQRDPDVIENHNLFGFDLPFLEHRALSAGIALEIGRDGGPLLLQSHQETLAIGPETRKRTRYSVPGRELIDTLDAVRRHDFVVRDMPSYRLKDVARYFGIASSHRTYITGTDIFDTYQHSPDQVKSYALDDVAEVDGLSRRLLGAPFALASMAPRRYERLASAGPAMGILEPILVRSYLRAGAALPYQAALHSAEDGLHEGGAVHLLATGIAEHVVKADVASLYPSLMRTFQIGPSCDRLGVLLSILDQLIDLRLQHKKAARIAAPGSIDANHHSATQAAMKILINAAYGYMGAGSMALFADGRAAGEVTRRGRGILASVLEALKKRGMALIEADTDGVYFAVPPDWSEEQERELVNQIGEELPAGINLEYEGRYRAMFSHEVKNYALLTYDDLLIVHGVALRSSRAEPFGERFLRQALRHTMLGDIQAVRTLFLDTVSALRTRTLTAADVATQVRLSKTPQTYLASRNSHQEPAYEALINAGRTHWQPGERVRFYRTSKGHVWLPDETEEAPISEDWRASANGERPTTTPEITIRHADVAHRRDYDIEYYIRLLITSYAARLRKALDSTDFEQLFKANTQLSLFDMDKPIEDIQPIWLRCTPPTP
ncbi:MAG: ribonuclease H-like domain-containing protein [Ktedonobacteraceae bacterium]|nr:ribonuclease H-like domain-containing protein [Ktedonobacteraceae bacterium]